jgi:hypothetical protein
VCGFVVWIELWYSAVLIKEIAVFDIQVHSCGDAKQRAIELSDCQSMEPLGRGCFAGVWPSDHGRVVRISHSISDWGYLSYLEQIQAISGFNPWVPRVYGAEIWMDNRGAMCMMVEMERLTRPWDEWGYGGGEWSPFLKIIQEVDDYVCGVSRFDWIEDNVQLMQVIRAIKRAKQISGCDVDMHNGNFMMRGIQLVVTDPLGYP